ncbi:hypothetical protein [Maridesulfovibrio hydrothermalis]|uniref:Uncharacterized protein n=1 Tax=Maridesulfovibrio hydrothermalis AM13 = DSM 14728 TaxID=1121451 RepID=L0RC85_9BACT|nr:hypothetical protein [Maridesulfovibrio hydrothermalis]CCO24388.1 conserved protein of unknown function [Maridesulfovibrio hydrothermalis AM13 = DSM 14728]
MNGNEQQNLVIRLNNCLETILELEQELEKLDLSRNFIDELEVLKGFMRKMEKIQVSEDEVERIESATGNFLQELKLPLGQADSSSRMFMRLQ